MRTQRDVGDIFEKGLTVKAGQTHVQRYMPELLEAIVEGRAGLQIFDKKEEECRMVVLTP